MCVLAHVTDKVSAKQNPDPEHPLVAKAIAAAAAAAAAAQYQAQMRECAWRVCVQPWQC